MGKYKPPFIVRADKAEEFINHKNPEAIKKIREVACRFEKELKLSK